MRVVVTGGAGYIGSVSARMLLDAGHDVTVLDTLERGHRAAVDERAAFVEGDVGDPAALGEALPGAEAVLHCAGYIEVAESMKDPGRYFANNVSAPLAMLQAMEEHGVRAIVFSSTAAVYGEPTSVPIPEDAAIAPINPYGASKRAFEEILEWYGRAHGFAVAMLRYFNVSGAWPDGSIGEAHDPETHVIPRILDAIATGQGSFEVFGGDYPTEDGTCVRDYIHVMDLGEAHRLALERAAGGDGGVFNLGNQRGYSNLQVVRTCGDVTGVDIDLEIGSRRPGDPAVLVAGNARAHRELGWEAERGELAQIIGDAWAFRQSHPSGYE